MTNRSNASRAADWKLRRRARRRLPAAWRSPLAVIGLGIAVLWIVAATFAPWLAPHDPLAQSLPRLTPPGEVAILGTDSLGRDVLSRLLYGARVTIPLAVILVVSAMVLGTLVGSIGAYIGGWVDELFGRLTDLFMAFPTVILAMVIAASLGPSLFNAVIAGIVVTWPVYARVARSLVLGLRSQNFVVASRMLGYSAFRSLRTDIFPNILGPILVLASLEVGTAILLLTGLSFLGLGAQPPTAEWGAMIAGALRDIDAWWLGVFPGLAILSIVMAFNFFGDSLRDVLDPLASGERLGSGGMDAQESSADPTAASPTETGVPTAGVPAAGVGLADSESSTEVKP